VESAIFFASKTPIQDIVDISHLPVFTVLVAKKAEKNAKKLIYSDL
jgi:hypothetical protein